MMVGEAPGYTEDKEGREPFVGESGRLLQQACAEVGLDWQRISLANTVACRPTTQKRNKRGELMVRWKTGEPIMTDDDPTPAEVKNCWDFLEGSIRRSKPRILVPVGAAALKRLTGRADIVASNGQVLESPRYPGVQIIPMVHPSHILHNTGARPELLWALQQIRKARDYQLTPTESAYRGVETIEDFRQMMAELEASDRFALDIEASGLRDFQSVWIISMAFSTKHNTGWVLPWRIGTPEFYDLVRADRSAVNPKTGKPMRPTKISDVHEFAERCGLKDPGFRYYWAAEPEVHERLSGLFQNERIIKIFHNAPYDIKVLQNAVQHQGFKLRGPIRDTMYMYFLTQGTTCKQSLEELTPRLTNLGNHKKIKDEYIKYRGSRGSDGDTYAIIPWDAIVRYNAGDSDATLQIHDGLVPALQAMPSMVGKNMLGFLDLMMMPAQGLLIGAEEWGVNIDREALDKGDQELTAALAQKEQELFRACSVEKFDITSVHQLREVFYDRLGFKVMKHTPKGTPSTDWETMELLKKETPHPAPKILQEHRTLVKLHGTYVKGLRDKLYADGRLHCHFNMTFSATGRTSSDSPNLQNIPRPRKGELVIKNFFIPTHPDWVFVAVDFGQAELRVNAWYARDDVAIQMFKDGRDIHNEVAVEALGLPPGTRANKEQRTIAKGINFGVIYGETGYGLADQLTIEAGRPTTPEEAQGWIDKVMRQRPRLPLYFEETKEIARKYERVVTAIGRHRVLPTINSDDEELRSEAERQAINTPTQSFSSDLLLMSVIRVAQELRRRGLQDKVKLWNLVHDNAIWEMPKGLYKMFLSEIALPNMTAWISDLLGFPFTADAEVGRPWGKLQHYCPKCQGLSVEEDCPVCTVVTASA